MGGGGGGKKNKNNIKNLTFKEYENLTIEAKAIYDSLFNGNARKWLLYPLLTGSTFGTSIFGSIDTEVPMMTLGHIFLSPLCHHLANIY